MLHHSNKNYFRKANHTLFVLHLHAPVITFENVFVIDQAVQSLLKLLAYTTLSCYCISSLCVKIYK